MEYKIDSDGDNGQIVIVDLPLEISCVDYSVNYFCKEKRQNRMTRPNYWVVTESDLTPKDMDIPVKEFKEVENAVEYARQTYLKFLREELARVRFKD